MYIGGVRLSAVYSMNIKINFRLMIASGAPVEGRSRRRGIGADSTCGLIRQYRSGTQTESDTLRHRLRIGDNLSAFERSRAQQLGVLLPPIGDLVVSH